MKKQRSRKARARKPRGTTARTVPLNVPKNGISQTILFSAGLIGGAFTLFGGLQTFIDLSKWARYLVSNWTELIFNFWSFIAHLNGHEPTHETAAVMTFFVSMQFLSLSAMMITPEHESPISRDKGTWPWQWDNKFLFHWTRLLLASFLAVLFFNIAIECIIFDSPAIKALTYLPGPTWGMAAIALAGLGFALLSQNWRAIGECIALAVSVGAFYFIIASGSAQRAFAGGPTEIDIYRNVVFKYSFAMLPLSLAGMLSGAASRYLLLRFLALAILLCVLYVMNLVAIAGFSASPPLCRELFCGGADALGSSAFSKSLAPPGTEANLAQG